MGEITVILLLALIFLGPSKLPELASGLGRIIKDIRKATSDVKNEIQLDDAIRKPFEELRDAVTLHPDELKRRDRLQKEMEETRRKVEQEIKALERANPEPATPEALGHDPTTPSAAHSPAIDTAAPTAKPLPIPGLASGPGTGTHLPAVAPSGPSPPPGTVPAAPSRDRPSVRGLPVGRPLRGPAVAAAPAPPPTQAPEKPMITQFLSEADLIPGDVPVAPPPLLPGMVKRPTPPPTPKDAPGDKKT
jgi:Sec-independent protein translocase protein TatA